MAGVKRDLVQPIGGDVMANVVIATGILPAKLSRQRRHQSLRGERQQTTIRYLVEAVTERVVGAQRQSPPLLGVGGLKTGITAVGIGAKLIDIPEALIERPLVRERRKTPIAHRLIAIELHLVRLMEPACTHEIDAQAPTANRSVAQRLSCIGSNTVS